MTGFVTGFQRRQQILLPDTLDDYISGENSVRFIDAFVDGLDLERMGFSHAEPEETGRPPYNPADLLKLYLYGYLNSVRSSRKLERECHRNIEVIWLMRKLAPDFKTIADFRKDNVDNIRPVFSDLVAFCKRLGLLGAELVAIDGSKFKAVNSRGRCFTPKSLKERIESSGARIDRFLRELDENDAAEEGTEQLALRTEGLKEKIASLKNEQQRHRDLLSKMEMDKQSEVCLTDPECRQMRGGDGKVDLCYNAQIAVDSKHKLIVEYDLVNDATDFRQLVPMAQRAKEALGVERLAVTADRGYGLGNQIRECVENGVVPYVPEADRRGGAAKRMKIPTEFKRDKFVYDPATDTIICPTGQRMTPRGPWRTERWPVATDDPLQGIGSRRTRLYKTSSCLTCPHFMAACTHNPGGRRIQRAEYEDVMDQMRARMKTEDGRRIRRLRKALVEHPFGTIKRGLNQAYLLLKGLRKTNGEMGLTMIAYDMRRLLSILGAKRLVAALTS